ncbi:hypothetical protein [Thiosulfativibrio zosterae]|uniref:DUF2628 domain-containing protein n=1 Tax=Thiosulfativibrio zosterae TaxID=2675053 RepID=A0A6F8PR34_9GAMM|nr:hypothetical protein [Thiosulfativibrio zosterae]BBP44592.1 hypothetical protein THMIRHAT_23380 [Thiosulfativibrio zosterae]
MPTNPTEYETAMLNAFVQKLDKLSYYQNAYQTMNLTGSGQPQLKWFWSWWGFGGGFAFLLYRKAYLEALVAFILGILVNVIPFGGLILMIVMGGTSPYFVVKRYATLKAEIERSHADPDARIQAMQAVGGFHTWVIWVTAIFYGLVLLGILSMLSMIS